MYSQFFACLNFLLGDGGGGRSEALFENLSSRHFMWAINHSPELYQLIACLVPVKG